MRIFWFVIFLSACINISAQSTYNADSVEKIFGSLPDTIRIREANNLMKHYMDVDFKKSMYYAEKAFNLIPRISNQKDVAYTYISWAIAQYNYGRFDSSLYYNQKALGIYQALADTLKMATAYNNISSAYNALGDFSAAAYYSYKALDIHEARKNWRKAAIASINLSSSYFESGDYAATLLWSRKGYRYYTTAGAREELGYAIQIFIDVYIAQKRIDSATFYLHQIQQLNKEFPNEYLETVNLSQRGELYALQGKYDSAIIVQKKCIGFYEGMEMSDGVLFTRLSLSRVYITLKKWDDAERYAAEAHRSAVRLNNKSMIVKSSMVLADIYKGKRQFDKALEFSQAASVYKDSIMMQSMRGSIQGRFFDVALEKETEQKLQAITTLEQRNQIIDRQWLVIILVTGGLLIMVVIAYLIRRVGRYRKRMNDQLTANNIRLNELNHEITGLVNTIIHDLKSPLNSVQGILSIMEMSAEKGGETAQLIQMANKALANGHDIVRQLLELREVEENPDRLHLHEIDCHELTQDIHSAFRIAAQQKCIQFSMEAMPCSFTSDKVLVRRVLDNLVSNALKFSPGEREVRISVKKDDVGITFEVSDQGPGFSDEDLQKIYGKFQKLSARPTGGENSNGLGLATVSLLIKQLRGTIALKTQPGKGSVFVVTFPESVASS